MSQVLCITGMHRSGTSLVASWLKECGLRIDDGQLMAEGVGNPHGHFEDEEFVELHADYIRRATRRSRGWIRAAAEAVPVDEEFRERARRMADKRGAAYDVWGWKDPRTTLFLEEWKRVVPETKVLLLWRPCTEVLGSLLRRSRKAANSVFKIGPLRAVRTWCAYNRLALDFLRAHPDDALLVSNEAAVRDDERTFAALRDRLGIDLAYRPIADLHDPQLMRTHEPTAAQRALLRLTGADRLEAELAAASLGERPAEAGAWAGPVPRPNAAAPRE